MKPDCIICFILLSENPFRLPFDLASGRDFLVKQIWERNLPGNNCDCDQLDKEDHRNPNHKFLMPGLMVNDLHGEIHGDGTAERGNPKQGGLGDAPSVFLRGVFVVHRQDDRDQTDKNKIQNPVLHH